MKKIISPTKIALSKFLKELEKGRYVNNYINQKLGRVGQEYRIKIQEQFDKIDRILGSATNEERALNYLKASNLFHNDFFLNNISLEQEGENKILKGFKKDIKLDNTNFFQLKNNLKNKENRENLTLSDYLYFRNQIDKLQKSSGIEYPYNLVKIKEFEVLKDLSKDKNSGINKIFYTVSSKTHNGNPYFSIYLKNGEVFNLEISSRKKKIKDIVKEFKQKIQKKIDLNGKMGTQYEVNLEIKD